MSNILNICVTTRTFIVWQRVFKGHNSGTNLRKMTCNNPKIDLAKMNAQIKFDENLPIGSQDIERKRQFCLDKGP